MSALKSISSTEPVRDTNVANLSPAPVKLSAAELAELARRQRARKLVRRLAIWVAAPTVIAAIYLCFLARNQYESVSTLVVRNGNGGHIVMLQEFMTSRDMLSKLEKAQHFAEHFKKQGDLIFGMSSLGGSETRYKVFRRFTSVSHDTATGVVTVTARAFDAKLAHDAVQLMVDEGSHFLASIDPAQTSSPVVVIARPSLPNESSYPRRAYGVLTAFFVSLAVFVIGALLIAAVREHAQF